MSGKRLIGVCALAIVLLGAWEASRWLTKNPATPLPATTPPTEPPQPILQESRPALPLKTAKKPITAPVSSTPRPPAPAPLKHVAPTAPPPPVYSPPAPITPAPAPEPRDWRGNDTAVTRQGQVVVRNDRQWIKFWSEHHPHEAAPEVDFARDMVVGVFAGARPADQFAIEILAVRTLPDRIVVDYQEKVPPPGTFAIGVTVYPYALKVIPLSASPVKFNILVAQP